MPRAESKKKREPLNRERITTAALSLIDAQGLESFTTRELGRALGCEAMAIYRHFPSKDAVLDAVVDRMMTKVEVPSRETGDWAERARIFARSYRSLARVHPNAFALFATRRFNTAGTFMLLDRVFASYLDEGFTPQAVARLYRTIANFTTGAGLQELADAAHLAAASRESVPEEFGSLAKVGRFFTPAHADSLFEWGLDLLLNAFAKSSDAPR